MDYAKKSLMLAPTLKALGDGGPGGVEGYASTFGNVDSYGDTIEPGAYRDGISDFITNGFLGINHLWGVGLGVGMIDSAHEDAKGLFVSATFYGDRASQDVRGQIATRLDQGKSVGLSIGYEPLEWAYRPLNAGERVPYGDQVRILKRIKLYEVSIVGTPADSYALATGAKAGGLRLTDHDDSARESVASLVARWRQLVSAEAKIGAAMSASRRKRISETRDALAAAVDELTALLAEVEPEPKGAAPTAAQLRIMALLEDSRRLGVAI